MTTEAVSGSRIGSGESPAYAPSYGRIDDIEERAGVARIVGWLLLADGPLERVLIRSDGDDVFAATRVPRPDLARTLPAIPDAAAGGFVCDATMRAFERDGRHAFTLVGVRAGRPVCRRRFELAPRGDPLPPAGLRARLAGTDSAKLYSLRGESAAAAIVRLLRFVRSEHEIASLLEVDCGAACVLAPLARRLPLARAEGLESDGEALAWLASTLAGRGRFARDAFRARPRDPELPFGDARFDLVVALSVLDDDRRDACLDELRRILRPEGALVLASYGRHAARACGDAERERAFGERGIVERSAEPVGPLPPAALVSPETVRERFAGRFSFVASAEGALDGWKDLHLLARD